MIKCLKHYRDKEKARLYRNRNKKRYYKKSQTGKRRRWTKEEIKMILDKKYPDSVIAKLLKRSVEGIQIKRSRIKPEVRDDDLEKSLIKVGRNE